MKIDGLLKFYFVAIEHEIRDSTKPKPQCGAIQQCNTAAAYYAVYWLPLANSAFLLAKKLHLIGWYNGTEMRNAI